MNKFILVGRLGAKPELKTGGKTSYCHLNVATDYNKKEGDSFVKATRWNSVTCFGKKAEFAAKYLEKGSWVSCEGTIDTQKTEQGFKTSLIAEEINFVGAKRSETKSEDSELGIPF